MALDGIFIYAVNLELQNILGSFVDRVFQISRFEFVLVLRSFKRAIQLFISVNPSCPRINLTETIFSKQQFQSSFCRVLNRFLEGSCFVSAKQTGLDRILFLEFEHKNRVAENKSVVLVIEIMGKQSDLILIDKNSTKIVDSVKSSGDSFLKEQFFKKLSSSGKLNVLNCSLDQLMERIFSYRNFNLKKALLFTIEGISSVVARELALNFEDKLLVDFDEIEKSKLLKVLNKFKQIVAMQKFSFSVFLEGSLPKEFCWFELKQFENFLITKKFASASELLDFFYKKKFAIERFNQQRCNVMKRINDEIEKINKEKLSKSQQLAEFESFEVWKIYADLLSANLHRTEFGKTSITVENFYSGGEKIKIKLNPTKTIKQNVQYYYKKFKVYKHDYEVLRNQIVGLDGLILFLKGELELLNNAKMEAEVLNVMLNLSRRGFYSDKFVMKKLSKLNE